MCPYPGAQPARLSEAWCVSLSPDGRLLEGLVGVGCCAHAAESLGHRAHALHRLRRHAPPRERECVSVKDFPDLISVKVLSICSLATNITTRWELVILRHLCSDFRC